MAKKTIDNTLSHSIYLEDRTEHVQGGLMAVRGNELVNGVKVRAYDNGGKTCDRYTVVYMDDSCTVRGKVMYDSFCMSEHPFHPQGIGMHGDCVIGTHLGKRVKMADLPPDCIRAVTYDCTDITITRASPY